MKEMRLTNAKTREKLSNFQSLGKGGLIIADRAYGTIAGMKYLMGRGSNYLLRYRSGAFKLYSETREWVEVTDFFRELEAGACGEVTLYYQIKGEYKPIRLCAIGKTEEGEKKGVERLKAMNRMKSRGKPPSEAQLANNRYVIPVIPIAGTEKKEIVSPRRALIVRCSLNP